MRCEDAKNELFEMVFGEPDDEKEALLQEHLLACEACREEERSLLRLRDAVRDETAEEKRALETLRERIRASLPARRRRGIGSYLRRPIPAYAAAAACALVAILARGLPPSEPSTSEHRPARVLIGPESPAFVVAGSYETSAGWLDFEEARADRTPRSPAADSL
ncbi:MAG: zf-HC2 domain-containing protein [Candidatus Eisenbacteria bacterium]|nr:zf-HC2 domain-containing protein [Candidatus Eisenbacteria bacterium]